jgi:hypothetical protein
VRVSMARTLLRFASRFARPSQRDTAPADRPIGGVSSGSSQALARDELQASAAARLSPTTLLVRRKRSSASCANQFHGDGAHARRRPLSLIATYVPPTRPWATQRDVHRSVGGPETAPQRRLAHTRAGFEPATLKTGRSRQFHATAPNAAIRGRSRGRSRGSHRPALLGLSAVASTNRWFSSLTSCKPPASRHGPNDCCLSSSEERAADRAAAGLPASSSSSSLDLRTCSSSRAGVCGRLSETPARMALR